MAVCVEALGGSLDVSGGYISMQNRELIESMASTFISHLEINGTPKAFFSYTQVKNAVLILGVSCVATPWPDGAFSSLVQILRQAAFVLRSDRDAGVSSTSYSVMAICNMAVTPHAPPVMIVTRGNEVDNGASMSMNTTAYSVMAICNMAVTPHAPPVMIVTRGNEVDNGASMSMNTSMFFSRSSL